MSFADFLRQESEKRRAAFYQHVRPWVAIGAQMGKESGWRMRYADFKALIELLGGMNSYEWRILVPLLDDPGLCELAEYCMGQAGRKLGELELAEHYGDAVQRELAPLLVKRLREAQETRRETARHNPQAENIYAQLSQELATTCQQAASWEIQCQDLRDRLVQAEQRISILERERDSARTELEHWARATGRLP